MKVPLYFWFGLFLEARVEILTKISLFLWSIWRHQKDHFEINWPLKKPCNFLAPVAQQLSPEKVISDHIWRNIFPNQIGYGFVNFVHILLPVRPNLNCMNWVHIKMTPKYFVGNVTRVALLIKIISKSI